MRTMRWSLLVVPMLLWSCVPRGDTPADLRAPPDLEVDAAACEPHDGSCDPNCRGYRSPAYCVEDKAPEWKGCGSCTNVGYYCYGFEYEMTCLCDGKWHLTYTASCRSSCGPDGGYACQDGGG